MIKISNIKIIIIKINIIILILFFITIILKLNTNASTRSKTNSENYLYCNIHNPSINEQFKDNEVIVILNESYGKLNKEINRKDFKTDNTLLVEETNDYYGNITDKLIIDSIDDLTFIKDDAKIINPDNYQQILSIKLKNNSKENVLLLVNELKKLLIMI